VLRPTSLLLIVTVGAAAACAAKGSEDDSIPLTPKDSGVDGNGETTPGDDTAPPGPANDFPAAPIIDKAPASAPTLFGPAGSGAMDGPCLIEPQVGSLIPRNFLRPRFRFTAPAGHNLFEIRLSTPTQKNDLVVYTIDKTYVLPSEIWTGISTRSIDTPITMTIRSGKYDLTTDKLTDGAHVGTTGTFTIAPAEAGGTIVYWVLPGGSTAVSNLKGFEVGQETVKDVLDPSKIAGSQCIGCHTSTPDGQAVAMSSSTTATDGSGPSSIEIRTLADTTRSPSFISTAAQSLLARKDQHAVAFSKAHWAAGDRMMRSALSIAGKREILWTNLETASADQGTGWGVLARTGDTGAAGGAAWSHDGKSIVYFSAPEIGAGVIDGAGLSDLMVVPYDDKKGGAATPLYKDPAWSSFYPQFAADDSLVAFTRVPRGQTSYNNKNGEIMVIPTAGGTPTRLVANDPPACLLGMSPGITNSWPKWSPRATESGGKTYYWLTFSSTRGPGNPQLYVAPIVKSGSTITTYPALYLWNQPAAEHNHTPAWDVFALPVK